MSVDQPRQWRHPCVSQSVRSRSRNVRSEAEHGYCCLRIPLGISSTKWRGSTPRNGTKMIFFFKFFWRGWALPFCRAKKNINQSVATWFLKSANSVLARKITTKLWTLSGAWCWVPRKLEKQFVSICSDFVFSKCQVLISNKTSKPICSHFHDPRHPKLFRCGGYI